MTARAELVAICDRYVEMVDAGDTDGIMELYAEDSWIEDPIGSERKVGKAVIREFYAGIAAMDVNPKMARIGPVTVCGADRSQQIRGWRPLCRRRRRSPCRLHAPCRCRRP